MGTSKSLLMRAFGAAFATLALAAVVLSALARPALADEPDEAMNVEALATLAATGQKVTQVSLGQNHSAAILEDGSLWAWGNNNKGQLGDSTNTRQSKPVQVQGLSGVKSVALGGNSSAALTRDGSVYTWGDNSKGQLGDATADRNLARRVSGLSGVTAIAMGSNYGAAIKSDGTLWMWGDNTYGQLGDGTTTAHSTPAQVSGLENVTQVALGSGHSAVIANGGKVMIWGIGGAGQLGIGSTPKRQTTPVEVPGLQGATQIALGATHSAAVKDGSLYVWGDNYYGEIGNGSSGGHVNSPVKVDIQGGVRAVALGNYNYHSAAIATNGSLYAWGRNSRGQLGNGNGADQTRPVRVGNLNVQQAALGNLHSAAILSDGSLATWGDNMFGQVGNGGTPQMVTSPATVSFPASSIPQKLPSSVTVNPAEITLKEGGPSSTVMIGGTGDGDVSVSLSQSGVVEATINGPILTVKPLKQGLLTIILKRAETTSYQASSASVQVFVTDAEGNYPAIKVMRLYNQYTNEHLLTTDTDEYASLGSIGWNQEGERFLLPARSERPVYRLYNKWNGDHLYTTNVKEYNDLGKAGWQQEGAKLYGFDPSKPGVTPIYRVYNPYMTANGAAFSHLWTERADEQKALIGMGWKDEGTSWYAML